MFNRFGKDNVKVFTFDGSSHDSHQNYKLINAVDKVFLTRLIPRVCKDYGYEQDVIDRCIYATTENYMYARCEYNY